MLLFLIGNGALGRCHAEDLKDSLEKQMMRFVFSSIVLPHRSFRLAMFCRYAVMVFIANAVWMSSSVGDEPADGEAGIRPNVVVILADDMGYGDISAYDGWIETPHLDRLAASGLRFTDFHSNGAVCSPTRAALMTGRYQQRAGIPMVVSVNLRHLGLQPAEVTFAECLKDAGYATAIFGKWHLGYQKKYNPTKQGFDLFRGYVSGNVDFFSHIDQSGVYDWWHQDELAEEPGYVTHLVTKHGVKFIEEHHDKPFCLYLAHEAPHYPYQGPHDTADRTVGGRFDNHGSRKDKKEAYREMVAELDVGVGEIVAALKKHGIDRKTLVFFFSDNGATSLGSCGPLRGTKGTVWEGGHRVPAVAWWPGKIQPGTTDETAIGMDLMPTMLDVCNVDLPAERRLDGVSLTPLLFRGEPLAERILYWQHAGRSAVRDGHWKLVVGARGAKEKAELYDLQSDLGERQNVAEKQPDRLQSMLEALRRWEADVSEGAAVQPAG